VFKDLVSRLHQDARITVMTGAGVSAASGVPTFRGADGLWKNFRPETLANADAFSRDPKLVWQWYAWRRAKIASCQPNDAHCVLAEWSRRFPKFNLITQNVDGLHERAGSHHAIRLHGSIWELKCWTPCREGVSPWRDETAPLPDLPPRCAHCGGLARPAVVWFGEGLDPETIAAAERAAECDVFLSIGTSAIVYPAAGLLHEAKRRGAMTVEINAEATEATGVVDVALRGAAEDILPQLAEAIGRRPT
jgi:NAD-dependent deacetylase